MNPCRRRYQKPLRSKVSEFPPRAEFGWVGKDSMIADSVSEGHRLPSKKATGLKIWFT